MSPTSNFEIANRYLGWGEPYRGLWFIGLEEASEWNQETLLEWSRSGAVVVKPPEANPSFKGFGRQGVAIRSLTCRIAQPLSQSSRDRSWEEYRDSMLWRPGCGLLQLNLFPLGKASWKYWPSTYKDLFGFDAVDRSKYVTTVVETRFPAIRQLWEESRPQAVICFGKLGWPWAREIFETRAKDEVELATGGRIRANNDQRIIFTPFFSYRHFSNADAAMVAETLRTWRVSIP